MSRTTRVALVAAVATLAGAGCVLFESLDRDALQPGDGGAEADGDGGDVGDGETETEADGEAAVCGNGTVEPGEACEPGDVDIAARNACGETCSRTCLATCAWAPCDTAATAELDCDGGDDDGDGIRDECLWCREHPPAGYAGLYAVGGSDREHLWAVGERGEVTPYATYRSAGGTWMAADVSDLAASSYLTAVWISPAGAPWVADSVGNVFAGDAAGLGWVTVGGGPVEPGVLLTGLAGDLAEDVWVVGYGGAAHWDGDAWTPADMSELDLQAVTRTAVGDTWAVGFAGASVRWPAGGVAEEHGLPGAASGLDVVQDATGTLWAGGGAEADGLGEGVLLRWSGGAWERVALPAGTGRVVGVWPCAQDGSLWVVVLPDTYAGSEVLVRRAGGWWERIYEPRVEDSNAGLYGIWGAATADGYEVWVVGDVILHYLAE
ncbi:MAG: hypothetical protein HY907_12790 [Deltaproteobacteria bacterium]|nr:hypothetical protein [Deltaproteobacteria bacterium]